MFLSKTSAAPPLSDPPMEHHILWSIWTKQSADFCYMLFSFAEWFARCT